MKHIAIVTFLLSAVLISCLEKRGEKIFNFTHSAEVLLEIPNRTVDKSALFYNNKNSLWTLNGQPYSGYAVDFYEDITLKEKIGIVDGKKENQSTLWYPDGHLRKIENYHKGRLHGEKRIWSSDSSHVLLSHSNFQSGKPHGEQKNWYPTGELHKVLNLNMGREEGIQQAFRTNGALYANYEAKEGRIFGLQKATLCFGLEDESIQY